MHLEFNNEERERKLRYVQRSFLHDFGKVGSRFIAEVVTGMTASGSVRLTEIARALGLSLAAAKVKVHRVSKKLLVTLLEVT